MNKEVEAWYENSDNTIVIGEMTKDGRLISGIKGDIRELLAIAVIITLKVLAQSNICLDKYCEVLKKEYELENGIKL